VSNASCTTNCFVPMIKVLDDAFGVEKGLMTTVHAYTGDQMLVDGPHSDLRRARAAAINIVPPHRRGPRHRPGARVDEGQARRQSLRVPVPDGSHHRLHRRARREVTVDEVNDAFQRRRRRGPLPRCSSTPRRRSCPRHRRLAGVVHVRLQAHQSIGNLVKVFGWYDNEWGYSNRLVDLVEIVGAANQR
jgi:glyceraldehyde 3-phosphate dehydrogenase